MRKLVFTELQTPTEYSYTWSVFREGALSFAQTLLALEVPPRSRICFMGHNSPEHFMALMGCILADCIFTEVYATNGPQACLQQIAHCGAGVIVCDSYERYREKFEGVISG